MRGPTFGSRSAITHGLGLAAGANASAVMLMQKQKDSASSVIRAELIDVLQRWRTLVQPRLLAKAATAAVGLRACVGARLQAR